MYPLFLLLQFSLCLVKVGVQTLKQSLVTLHRLLLNLLDCLRLIWYTRRARHTFLDLKFITLLVLF